MNLVKMTPWNWFLNEPAFASDEMLYGSRRAPEAPVSRLHDDIDRLFGQTMRTAPQQTGAQMKNMMLTPKMDVHGDDKSYCVTVEVPGVDQESIKISLHDDALIISGEKKCEQKSEDKEHGCYHSERAYGSFQRVLGLPEDADRDNISAAQKNGVLTVCIPRKTPESRAAREIAITHEA